MNIQSSNLPWKLPLEDHVYDQNQCVPMRETIVFKLVECICNMTVTIVPKEEEENTRPRDDH
jgi:hypothetical protein